MNPENVSYQGNVFDFKLTLEGIEDYADQNLYTIR